MTPPDHDPGAPAILLTGATGYVGGRLLTAFAGDGVPVRCLTRRPRAVRGAPGDVEVVRGDVTDPGSLAGAFDGIDVAYYLVHSMGGEGSFRDQDRRADSTQPGRSGCHRRTTMAR